ncbi:heavy metal translocating P-type ATPase [Undibacterium sp. LFS511W]|uniref:Heavy metal translocating P-type ATPase n=2 Tax=Undibacterium luofuense TaxID=2828733 RepID=A0A941DP64_9BURK|nr:heavy metal translocating P-type ATPase [Undibacterium luofuense]MBR7783142.1 heavy metal translocating P-type ATPase [Undibacterium luofuense]
MEHDHQHQGGCCGGHPAPEQPAPAKPAKDPVCGMSVVREGALQSRWRGVAYYFCSPHCQTRFDAAPENFVQTRKVIPLAGGMAVAAAPVKPVSPAALQAASASCCGGHAKETMVSDAQGAHTDPVCGMKVNENSQHQWQYQDQTWYFCCNSCLQKFSKDPQAYLDPERKAARAAASKAAAPDAVYMCPMDPEIEQIGPGICPICGMALEPKEATLEEDDSELRDMEKRFRISLLLALPLLILTMTDMLPGVNWHQRMGMQIWNWLQCALATPVVVWLGKPFFERAIASFRSRNLNMFSLIGIGTATAYGFSLLALLAPGLLPQAFMADGMPPLYFEAAAVIISLVLLGQILELRARAQTGSAIRRLLTLTPSQAVRIGADGSTQEIALNEVQRGDLLLIRPGASVPVDGRVVSGESYVDEAMLTGEPVAVSKQVGDALIAGTLNQQGSLQMRAEKIGSETLLANMIQLVNQASRSRAPVQQLADKVAGWFVPAVILIAVLAFAGWALWGPAPGLAHGLMAAVSVLIIACPCALGLATPISVTVGMGRGASEGILIKDAAALEQLGKTTTLIIDKTGTLTEGKPVVSNQWLHRDAGQQPEVWLALTAALESQSAHPLAQALLRHVRSQQADMPEITLSGFTSVHGAGVQADWYGRIVRLGKPDWLAAQVVDLQPVKQAIQAAQQRGDSLALLSEGKRVVAWYALSDQIKANSKTAIAELRAAGLRVILMTGDHAASAQRVATELGISEWHADVTPEDKYRMVEQCQAAGQIVAMAGDGVNDAPALAKANTGIAMGNGSDVALHSAQCVLVKGDLQGIRKAIALSQRCMGNIRQNLWFAFGYNFIGVPVAAGLLYPFTGLLLSPMLASAAMSLSSVSVISNALRLRRQSL